MHDFIMAIDQGTTGTTALILQVTDKHANPLVAKATVDFPQYFPQAGWVEHDLDEIWASVQKSCSLVIDKARLVCPSFHPHKIHALGITNQRESLCFYDRLSSQALRKAIVWQCKRSTGICQNLSRDPSLSKMVKDKTGLVIDPYFSASKLSWVMEEEPHVAKQLREGQAVIGTIDSYLISRLTQGQSFVTEASNASRTLLFNIHTGRWDSELLALFRVPRKDILARVEDSAGLFGKTQGVGFLPDGIPITGVLGDQQAALAGQTCFQAGEAKCTYGTGAFLLLQLGEQALASQHGILTTVSWSLKKKLSYALEGSAFIAGAAVQFMRDKLALVASAQETEYLAADVLGAPEVYFVPALAGLGAPWWNPKARGAFFGLTRGTSKNQMIRAALEGMAFQVCDLLEAMQQDAQAKPLKILRVDGGASANSLLMQVQANLANIIVERPSNIETTAFGAGLFAALGAGIFSSLEELKSLRTIDALYHPISGEQAVRLRQKQISGWKRAVKAVELFAAEED